ncbi:hypothetical protein JOF56_003369 [Kibdelosporangium banguiense]|uniref:PPE family domain-containing protein n=1 Tax=Kibdelosporangium banguiense TaxID=1365924 RepID=A0ABS4TF59_9PSEU|nr:hypothetical protein [Kibdelosporangium banguiense]MBP2322984.1 hypothetical protein [Kibdelosporangium banguiense]
MAGDRHHSGFDQDEFERYDTFDAPVSETTDTGRDGLFGDLGRLIDQIRIDNAAKKLDENVSMGEDRVLNQSGNWASVPHQQLYESVHAGNDPAEAYALAREWTDLGNMMADNSRAMDEIIRGTESGWQGVAAQAARESTLKLATWGGDAAQTSQYMGTRIAEQGLTAERAKASMPEPVDFDWEQMLRQGFATGGLAGLTQAVQDVQAVSEKARSAHEQAVQVMVSMEGQSRSVDQTTPRFVVPPDATTTDGDAVNGLMMRGVSDATAGSAPTTASALLPLSSAGSPAGVPGGQESFQGSNFQGGNVQGGSSPGSGFQGGSSSGGSGFQGGSGFSGGAAPNFAGGAGFQPAAASFGPPANVPPNGPQTATTTSGFVPPGGTGFQGDTTYRPPNYQPPPNFQQPNYPGGGYFPPGGGPYRPGGQNKPGGTNNQGGGGPYAPGDPRSGYMPPRIDPLTGEPYKPNMMPRPMPFAGGPGVPGVPGGGGGTGGGFAPRGGAPGFIEQQGGMRNPGFGAGAGVMAAEEAAMRGGNPGNPAAAGRPGAAGAPGMGMGGMGGGGQRGEEDKEHRSKYVTGEKVVDEPGRMAPPVIGDKTARKPAGDK